MKDSLKFQVPDQCTEPELVSQLAESFSIEKKSSTTKNLEFYDTFDWRLFNNAFVLYQAGDALVLSRLNDQSVVEQTPVADQPSFAEDLPDSGLKSQVAPVTTPRALLKLTEARARKTTYKLLDQDRNMVARFAYEKINLSNNHGYANYLALEPVRGYPKQLKALTRRVEELGCTPSDDNLFLKILETAERQPGAYSPRLDVQLEPDMPSAEAAKKIFRFLLQVMRANEANIKADIDIEFLHDFRVAVRRTRSALSQIKGVFPEEVTARFKADFAYIGKSSNDLRDLDVYLLAEEEYKAMLPDILREDIEPLFDYLRSKRGTALKKVTRTLNSKKYAKIMSDWEKFLASPVDDSETAVNGERPIIDLARKRIHKRYRRVVKSGKSILNNAEDEKLHALRIDCKKLRYLLEFFSSLFPEKQITNLIRQLKKLQDNLGDFNDLAVQEAYLLRISAELPLADEQSRKALLAVGSLIGKLDEERQQVKNAFAQTFEAFVSKSNKKLFKQLFA